MIGSEWQVSPGGNVSQPSTATLQWAHLHIVELQSY